MTIPLFSVGSINLKYIFLLLAVFSKRKKSSSLLILTSCNVSSLIDFGGGGNAVASTSGKSVTGVAKIDVCGISLLFSSSGIPKNSLAVGGGRGKGGGGGCISSILSISSISSYISPFVSSSLSFFSFLIFDKSVESR